MSALIARDGEGVFSRPLFTAQPRPDPLSARRSKSALILVEPRPLMRECLSRLLQASARNFRIVAVSDPAEVVDLEACSGGAALIVVSIGGTEVTDGPIGEAIAPLRRALPDTPIVVLSDCEAADRVAEALRCGVRGYIPTSLPLPAVIEALRFVRAGGTFVPASAFVQPVKSERSADEGRSSGHVGAMGADGFTTRELEVLALLRRGQSNKLIAHELRMQESTLKVHVRNIKRKLRVTNRTQAALLAHQLFENQGGMSDPADPAPQVGSAGRRQT